MSFCTAVNCIDGRIQLPVIDYLKKYFQISYVDIISEAGPVMCLAEQRENAAAKSIIRRINISIEAHESSEIAIVAHHDCAGNPVADETQLAQLQSAVQYIARQYSLLQVIGLWVDETWSVNKIYPDSSLFTGQSTSNAKNKSVLL